MKLKSISIVVSFITVSFMVGLIPIDHATAGDYPETARDQRERDMGSVLHKNKEEGGFTLFGIKLGNSKKDELESAKKPTKSIAKETPAASPVKSTNIYLWQATLDAVQFMPILASDSSGGVLSTDWYEDADFPNERYKFNILIKSTELRADSIHVTAFKQILEEGRWKDIKVSSTVAGEMEEKIFIKARELKAWNQSQKQK